MFIYTYTCLYLKWTIGFLRRWIGILDIMNLYINMVGLSNPILVLFTLHIVLVNYVIDNLIQRRGNNHCIAIDNMCPRNLLRQAWLWHIGLWRLECIGSSTIATNDLLYIVKWLDSVEALLLMSQLSLWTSWSAYCEGGVSSPNWMCLVIEHRLLLAIPFQQIDCCCLPFPLHTLGRYLWLLGVIVPPRLTPRCATFMS